MRKLEVHANGNSSVISLNRTRLIGTPAGKVSGINIALEQEDEKSVDNMLHSLFTDICCSRYLQTDKLIAFPIHILIEHRKALPWPSVSKLRRVVLPKECVRGISWIKNS